MIHAWQWPRVVQGRSEMRGESLLVVSLVFVERTGLEVERFFILRLLYDNNMIFLDILRAKI